MVKKQLKKEFVKICLNCGSTKITMPPAGLDCKLAFRDYCHKCGNIGNFPEIEKTKMKEFQKKLKKNKQKPGHMGCSIYKKWKIKSKKTR